jgi:hypothetical protein
MGLIRRRTSRRFVAWLAIAAMWLLVAAPTVSRGLPALVSGGLVVGHASHGLGDEHSSMAGMPDMVGMPAMPGMPEMPGDPAQHMDQCGYCVLLSHTPLLSGAFVVPLLAAPSPAVAPVMSVVASRPAQPLLSANPRGPPSILPG